MGDKDAANGDKTHTVYGKDGLIVNDKDGKEAVSLKVANGQDGNAQSATLTFAKGADGKSGTGVITGLADLADDADGTSATNKNHVDGKVSDLNTTARLILIEVRKSGERQRRKIP